jgi:hypothetical protein
MRTKLIMLFLAAQTLGGCFFYAHEPRHERVVVREHYHRY